MLSALKTGLLKSIVYKVIPRYLFVLIDAGIECFHTQVAITGTLPPVRDQLGMIAKPSPETTPSITLY